jgi:hypothetical protein
LAFGPIFIIFSYKEKKDMKNVYLIFPNPSDVYYNTMIICTKEELNTELIELEIIDFGKHYSDYSWVIFENGIMIQG